MMDKWDIIINFFWVSFMSPDKEGAPRAKELIKWYVTGNGSKFSKTDETWGNFMRGRAKIKEEADRFYKELAQELCADKKEKTGNFERNAKQISLESEAMKLTLHGCHRLNVKGAYIVEKKDGNFVVIFRDNTWTWFDKGDLHDELITTLNSDIDIPDEMLRKLGELLGGKEYPIEISWKMTRSVKIPREKTKCSAECKDFKNYGYCDNKTYDRERCHLHR